MTSFIRNSLISSPVSRSKRLAFMLLVSFCLTYMGQAFAMPMVCMMPSNDVNDVNPASVNSASPCHQTMAEPNVSTQPMAESETMDCCEQMNSAGDTSLTLSSHDCSCSDGGCGASLTFLSSFSCSSLTISDQPHYYSTSGFPSQIDSALFRPPIA